MQCLLVLAKASYEMLDDQIYSVLGTEARLIAERDQKGSIVWPQEFDDHSDLAIVSQVRADQQAEFFKRRASLRSQLGVLESRVEQLSIQIDGVRIQKESTEKQIAFILRELIGLRELSEKKLVPVTRLYSMERERQRLEGVIGQMVTDAAKAQGQIGEYKIQTQQLSEKFQEEVASSLVDVRQKLSDLWQRAAIAKDVLRRVDVTAPVSGTVQNLKIFSIGQVVRAGEPFLDIVPQNERLIVEVQFSPTDIDGVHVGQDSEIRFPSFHSRLIPLLMGKVESLSHDRLFDEVSKQPYYRGIVVLDKAEIPKELRLRIRAGMPSQVIVASGERTVLNYLISPLSSTLKKTFID